MQAAESCLSGSKMSTPTRHRNIIIAASVFLLTALLFYTGPSVKDFYQVQAVGENGEPLSQQGGKSTDRVSDGDPASDSLRKEQNGKLPSNQQSETKEDGNGSSPVQPDKGASTQDFPISRLHYLVPASKSNRHFCYNMLSSAATRWPIPTLLGWHGEGEFDAHVTHLAKLRAFERYFDNLESMEDDDLVIIVDGYDIMQQLPPEILIQRYFEVAKKADARLAKRSGISVDEARERGLRQSVFWGPDKMCFPIVWTAARCWAVPASGLGPHAFGPNSGNGDMMFNDARWLNSGTVMARVDDFRTMLKATMEEINASYDPNFQYSESDQYWISTVWGRQEYFRSLQALNGKVPKGPPNKEIPEKREDNQTTEYHIAIDYESALFQTKAAYEPFLEYLEFNKSGIKAETTDMFHAGAKFVPQSIDMPASVYSALEKLYESIPQAKAPVITGDWIRNIKLGVNMVTKHIFATWHCTGPKHFIEEELPRMWWYPHAKSLVEANVRAYRDEELITRHPIDGRLWASKNLYPEVMEDDLGGAWSDLDGSTWVPWHQMCGRFNHKLFGGEYPELLEKWNAKQEATQKAELKPNGKPMPPGHSQQGKPGPGPPKPGADGNN